MPFNYVKSLKYFLKEWCIKDSIITLAVMVTAAFGENPLMAKLKATPEAGGCSVSITTIIKIEIPTANEYITMDDKYVSGKVRAHKEPTIMPTKYPPIIFLGWAAILLGMAKTIKAVAPIEAIIIGLFSIFNNMSAINREKAAKALWNM